MVVRFYRYTGDFRKCNKSDGLTLLLTYNATYLKEPESIRSINLRIQYANAEDKAKLMQSNYCYIEDLGRYYEIRPESILELGGIIVMALEEDDIMSNLSEVMAVRAIIDKQESYYNLYLNDNSLRVYQNSLVFCRAFPAGLTANEIILTIAGS